MHIDQTMPDFDQIQLNTHAFSELETLLKKKKIPNALLFYGEANTRKKEAGLFVAQGANCLLDSIPPCGHCRACGKILTGNHPDIHMISLIKGKKNITISQIRDLTINVTTKPNEARTRLIMISDADLMNVQAQNALLKLLEEPPEKTVFVLTAQKKSWLLPTIQSRCRKIRFKSMTEKIVAQCLTDDHKVEEKMALTISRTSGGDLTMAKRLLNLDPDETSPIDWITYRKWLLDNIVKLIRPEHSNVIQALSLSWQLSRSPEAIGDTLAILNTFFRDLMIFKWSPKAIINLDFYQAYADIYEQVPSGFFPQWLASLLETEKRLLSNSSLRLSLDRFFLKLAFDKG